VEAKSASTLSAELHDRAASIATEVLRRNRFALAAMGEDERAHVEAVLRAVAARLVEEPRARLETLDGGVTSAARVAAFRELFDTNATEVRKQRENKRAV
jgi:hypothetical protein